MPCDDEEMNIDDNEIRDIQNFILKKRRELAKREEIILKKERELAKREQIISK